VLAPDRRTRGDCVAERKNAPNSRNRRPTGGFFLHTRSGNTAIYVTSRRKTMTVRLTNDVEPDKKGSTDDQRNETIRPLPPPEELVREFPIRGTDVETLISATRRRIKHVMNGADDRLLVIIGPCSIHDPDAAMEYARKLRAERERYVGTLEVVMRVY